MRVSSLMNVRRTALYSTRAPRSFGTIPQSVKPISQRIYVPFWDSDTTEGHFSLFIVMSSADRPLRWQIGTSRVILFELQVNFVDCCRLKQLFRSNNEAILVKLIRQIFMIRSSFSSIHSPPPQIDESSRSLTHLEVRTNILSGSGLSYVIPVSGLRKSQRKTDEWISLKEDKGRSVLVEEVQKFGVEKREPRVERYSSDSEISTLTFAKPSLR